MKLHTPLLLRQSVETKPMTPRGNHGGRTTPGTIAENKKLMDLVNEHGKNTQQAAEIVIADHKYGTTENYVTCQQRRLQTHRGDIVAGSLLR